MWFPRGQGEEGKGVSCATEKCIEMQEREVFFFPQTEVMKEGWSRGVVEAEATSSPPDFRREQNVLQRRSLECRVREREG